MRADIAEKLKKLRKEKRISQKVLAEKAGLSVASIQGYEQRKYKPSSDSLLKIADALNLSANEILNLLDNGQSVFLGPLHFEKMTNEEELLEYFALLNDIGQKKAVDYVEDLATMPKYQKGNEDVPDPEG